MRKYEVFILGLFFVSAWSQEAFVYQDRLVIEKVLDQVYSVMIPIGVMNVEFQPIVPVTFERTTNLYPDEVVSYVKEYM
ncbi:MAG: hypothetical protein ACK4TN_06625, partial [Brevinematales bacterium]